ncbi:MAG: DNRLRE domain-containing protein [Puniceicoccaceae bacterium]
MKEPIRIIISLIILFAAIPALWSATVSIEPTKDNSMFEEADESNGKGTYLFSGQTAPKNNNARRRALLQFDLNGVIPAGSTIESVSLELTMNRTITGSQAMTLHRLNADWGEGSSNAFGQEGRGTAAQQGDVTWRHTFFSTQFWTSQGGDYVGTASATTSVGGNGKYTWSGAGMVDDVQAWVDNSATNFGWILVGLEGQTSAKRFISRESTTVGDRPKLTITYSEAAATWAGYPIEPDGRSVFTDGFLGWVDTGEAPWIWVYALNRYIYAPEQNISAAGGWVWIGQ